MRAGSSSVDQFTTPMAMEQFDERRDKGIEVIHTYGLAETSIAIGGVGLAVQGLDTYVENVHPFDADLVVQRSRLDAMQEWAEQTGGVEFRKDGLQFIDKGTGMPVSLLGELSADLKSVLGAGTYEGLTGEAVMTEHGILTLPATKLAKAKLSRTSVKDIAGILKAQVVASATEHDILNDPDWQFAVDRAMHYACLRLTGSTWLQRKKFPAWMGRLAATNFDHPAFRQRPHALLRAA